MPRFNFTFQEASPLITYTGFWTEGSKDNDTFFQEYDGSFRVTNATGAQATLIFNGTGVSLFGAMRPNHGDYSVSLGDNTVVHGSGTSQDNLFKIPLFQSYNLPYQQHTVEVTDEPTLPTTSYFDLDFVQIERVVGRDNDTLFVVTIDDTSPLVTYVGSWEPSSTMASLNNNQTIHQTLQSDSTLHVTFQGCCIELYGVYANAAFTVAVDDGLPMPMQGQDLDLPPNLWHPHTLLYVADGLPENTNHTVSLTTTFVNEKRPFFFDYSVVRSTQNITGSLPPLLTPVNNTSKKTLVAAIAGASIGGAVLLSLIVAACIVWRRRQRVHTSFQPDTTTETRPENASRPRSRWFPWLRDGRSLHLASVTAWYPPDETQSQSQNVPGTHGHNVARHNSSVTINNGSPLNVNVDTYSAKRRADFRRQTVGPTHSVTSSASPVQVQSSSSINGETSGSTMVTSTTTKSRPAQGRDSGSTVISSPSASRDQQATTSFSTPIREEDAGLLYHECQEDTLPPAYNPGWVPRSS